MDERDARTIRPRSRGVLRWALPICAVCVAGLAAALVGVLLTGGEDASASEPPRPRSSATFAASATPSLDRLTDSAMVTGRVLARAADARDLARIGRMADQQLVVVQAAVARIAGLPTSPEERRTRGALLRATQAHRTYLSSLARLPDLAAPDARRRVGAIRAKARLALTHYRAFLALVPGAARAITTSGLGDLAGLGQAIDGKERAEIEEREAEEAAAAEAAARAEPPASVPSYHGGVPTVSRVTAVDAGGSIEVTADYCDRTPGAVNDFAYTFRIVDAEYPHAETSYRASQTRACNTIGMSFVDDLPYGTFDVVVIVENLTNAVSGSGLGSVSVID